ncbi:MAG: hypothetical protein HYZ31_07655 [Gammaproteobacteria bacterium]|nr:hypothetical protein [Gammaproteobacteria bacterium]
MPWWAITYLVALTLMITIALIKDYRDQKSFFYILAEFASGAIGFVFVYGYFNPETSAMIGWLVIPLLIFALAWDQYALSKMKKSSYVDLSEQENKEMDRYSRLFAFLFISPCYLAGASLSWRLISS